MPGNAFNQAQKVAARKKAANLNRDLRRARQMMGVADLVEPPPPPKDVYTGALGPRGPLDTGAGQARPPTFANPITGGGGGG